MLFYIIVVLRAISEVDSTRIVTIPGTIAALAATETHSIAIVIAVVQQRGRVLRLRCLLAECAGFAERAGFAE